jgi:DNA polymerase elongation subunit (family B)
MIYLIMNNREMEVFVYRWDYIHHTIYGSLPNGLRLEVSGFIPWEYVPSGESHRSIEMKTLVGSVPICMSKVPSLHPNAIVQFLSTRGLYQTGWVLVDEADVHGKVIRCKYTQLRSSPRMDVPDLHVISFDIEAYSANNTFPNPALQEDKIICISCVSNQNGTRSFSGSEDTFVGEFFRYIMDADMIVGYNTHGFDWRYLLTRHKLDHSSKYKDIPSEIVVKSWSSSAFKNNDLHYISIPGIICLDIYSYIQRSFKIDDYRLDTVSQYFDAGKKIDMPIDKMWRAYEQGNVADIVKYCEQDCQLVLDIIAKSGMINDVMALSRVTYTPAELLFTSGQQVRIRSMLTNECIKYGYVDDFKYSEPEPYQGAYVIEPVPGIYDHCACMDFASLYPSIIIAENICYSTYQNGTFNKEIFGIIPNLIKRLVEERNAIRHRHELRAYANALKVCANSIYGVFGAKGKLCLMPAAARVTQVGRESLEKAVAYLNAHGYKVIYGDTDSCIYTNGRHMPDDEHIKLAEQVTNLFASPIQMKFECAYKRFLVLGKKMYITMDQDNRIRYKGVVPARRDSSKFIVDSYIDIAERVMTNTNFRDHCRSIICSIAALPREKFIIKKTYNGPYKLVNYPLEVYNRRYGPLKQGETVWVIVSHGTSLGDRLRPANSNSDIDYLWYLQKLVNPIDLIMSSTKKVFRMKHNIELYSDDDD